MLRGILFEELMAGQGGQVALYHYASTNTPTVTLNPTKFGANSYSRREANTSTVPRVFFYLNPQEKEPMFDATYNLYTTSVSFTEVYNMIVDPDGIKDKFRSKYTNAADLDSVLKHISGWVRDKAGWKRSGTPLYNGVYYRPGFDVVIWFAPITVERVSDSERQTLESVSRVMPPAPNSRELSMV